MPCSAGQLWEQRERNSIKEFGVREQFHMKCIFLIVHIFVIYNRLNIFMDRFVSRKAYPQLLEICVFERNNGFYYNRKVTSDWDAAARQSLSNTCSSDNSQ